MKTSLTLFLKSSIQPIIELVKKEFGQISLFADQLQIFEHSIERGLVCHCTKNFQEYNPFMIYSVIRKTSFF